MERSRDDSRSKWFKRLEINVWNDGVFVGCGLEKGRARPGTCAGTGLTGFFEEAPLMSTSLHSATLNREAWYLAMKA